MRTYPRLPVCVLALGAAMAPDVGMALPAATPPGTRIDNTAILTVAGENSAQSVPSNMVTLTVGALLDVTLTAAQPTLAIGRDDVSLPVAFVVRNTGNAEETFALTATVDRGARIAGIAIDGDGSGSYLPGRDREGSAVTLTPGAGARIFVLVRGGTDGALVTATATAASGHGAPGSVAAPRGGVEVVIGASGASATATTTLTDAEATARLDKSQTVLAPDGSTRAIAGAVITYQLEARFAAASTDAEVVDAIPAGTRYLPGTLTLDGRLQTEAADDDAARFEDNAIHVALGDVRGPTVRTIRFQTIIQ